MELSAQNVYGATIVLAAIISERRPMPQRGKYLIARLHAKLLPEFNVLNGRRDELIKAYNNPQMKTVVNADTGERTEVPMEGEWQVPDDKLDEFNTEWQAICDEKIEVDVQAIPQLSLSLPNGSDGAIEASELITLGELVYDTAA